MKGVSLLMAEKGLINTRVQHRRDTSALWSSNNPTLHEGELGIDTTNNRIKIGDGSTSWNSLDYLDTQVQIIRWN